MGDNIHEVFVKEVFPLVLEILKCDKRQNILITYDTSAYKFWRNSDYYKSQNLSSGGGGNELNIGLEEVEKIIDEYIKSNTNISNSLLTISDGDIGSDKSI